MLVLKLNQVSKRGHWYIAKYISSNDHDMYCDYEVDRESFSISQLGHEHILIKTYVSPN